MAAIEELITLVTELEDQLSVCTRCGLCQSVCPLYAQTGDESDVARGKLTLLNGLGHAMFDNPDGVLKRLNRCLLCGSCAANCPSGVNALEIFIKARAILGRYRGLPMAKRLVFRQMLAKPGRFDRLMEGAVRFQSVLLKPNQNTQSTSCARIRLPLISERHLIAAAKTPFHRQYRENRFSGRGNGPKVLFFTGCLIDKIMPEVALDSLRALVHGGCRILVPDSQGCCGIPALAGGDITAFDTLVKHHLSLFDALEFDFLVTACATCTATIKKIWPTLVREETLARKADALARKTLDISQFLVETLDIPTLGAAEKAAPVTCHDPCHLKKSLGISAQPRALVARAGYEIREMEKADACCGMGGSFNLFHYDLSRQIGALKQAHITATGCPVVATGCPACILQISDMLSQAGAPVRVCHPVQIYAAKI